MSVVIGVDIGATNLRVAIADLNGNILLKEVEKTPRQSGLEVVNQIIQMSNKALGLLGLTKGDVKSIGVGTIGPLDLKRGIVVNPSNLKVGIIPVVEGLNNAFESEIRLLNDCVAAVLGERKFGAGKNLKNIVYVTISTGIGCGAIVDDHLLIGKDGNAHEIGHVVIDKDGLLECGCGRRGHWEAYCSGRGIVKYAKFLIMQDKEFSEKSLLKKYCNGDFSRLSSELIFKSAKEGDELSLKIVRETGLLNAIGFANIINVYDPELITVGGSIPLNNDKLVLEPIRNHVSEYSINRIPEIILTPLGEDIVLYGALAAALE
ncbi:MAG: ROK family protein [Nitrososphaerota archaeon]|nr:ROK family protein [Nitrososphaerota archaeon]